MDSTTKVVMLGLLPMYEKAIADRMWFYCSYQAMWFSPRELLQEQINGQFIWGAPNWELRDPQELVMQLENEKKAIEHQIEKMKLRMSEAFTQIDLKLVK